MKELNLAGRDAYFQALHELWPELLSELMENIAPQFASLWADRPAPTGIMEQRFKWHAVVLSRFRSPENKARLSLWARGYRVKDAWILDAAVNTIIYHYEAGDGDLLKNGDWVWMYVPSYLRIPFEIEPFQDASWVPSNFSQFGMGETWGEFSRRIRSQLDAQLAAYRLQVNARRGIGKGNLSRDAAWTVRYQKGETAKAIAAELRGPYRDHGQAVFRAIDRFAKSIDLTLPGHRT
jgi:hypothetical protein